MKRVLCLLLALLTVLPMAGCTSRAEKEAAALEALRLEAVESAKSAVRDYNEAADAYKTEIEEVNGRIGEVLEVNAAFDEALDAVQARIDEEPIPYDPETLTALQEALASAREARVEDPVPLEVTVETFAADDSLSTESAQALAAQAAQSAQQLRKCEKPALMDVPDYSAQLAAVDAALEPYAASVERIRPVIAPSDEYVTERLLTVGTIAAANAVTEDHDPNGNLGKDGGYIGCVFFRDSRISVWSFRLNPGSDRNDPVDVGTQGGGSVEIYATQEEAEKRLPYLDRFKSQIGIYGVLGSLVIRVTDQISRQKQRELFDSIKQALLPEIE
ncbi:MAG: hypothetical protein IKR07_03375 [Oscillospiraceae bacterium]|nr:hypothetical protein [Oscillospiraceae bacterium]